VSDQDQQPEQQDSLLRRSIEQPQEPRTPDEDMPDPEVSSRAAGIVSPIPGYTVPAQPEAEDEPRKSPIRPTVRDDTEPQNLLTPSPPTPAVSDQPLTPREQMQRAEEALINLRQKMAKLAADFADGQLNRAQFDAIYARYSEQRDITERLLARDPESQAWQSVVQPGHTQFLKEHFAARVLSYAIYALGEFAQIGLTGALQVGRAHVEAVARRLEVVVATQGTRPGPAHRMAKDGHCVLFVPGEHSIAVVIFSREPSIMQINRIVDIHVDFERANHHALRSRDFASERLVFPHRALFEEKRS
jgi:hypothetical protein